MNVKFAAQILSSKVAAGMCTHISFKKLPEDAMHTVNVIERFDRLFDIFNCNSRFSPKKYKTPFKGEDFKMTFLNETLDFLKNLQILSKNGLQNKTNTVSFINGWIISINSLIGLWKLLKDLNFQYILTRRLNQDPLENFFGSIRQQGGNSVNPTAIQFGRAFKKTFCMSFLQHSGSGANCEDDFEGLVSHIKEMGNSTELNFDLINTINALEEENRDLINEEE